jgi:hypothetical protein
LSPEAYRSFLVVIHDASPAFARETRAMIRDLMPLVGRRLSFAVVPDWQGKWPLASHRDYCGLVRENAEQLLLHGYFHRRQRGRGPVSLLAEACDEMNGLDAGETQLVIERGQDVFTDVFGRPARGFLAPAWQAGRVRSANATALGLEHILGFFSLESRNRPTVPLATWTWDCGRWGWLGHVGHGVGQLRQSPTRIPVLAIHPRDLDRGFWPTIRRLTRDLLDAGYEPTTPAALLDRGTRVAA